MRVSVIPVGARPIQDRELVGVALPWRRCMARVTVHVVGHMQAVLVDGGRLRQLIHQLNAHALSTPQPDQGPEIAAGVDLQGGWIARQEPACVAPHCGRLAWPQRRLASDGP